MATSQTSISRWIGLRCRRPISAPIAASPTMIPPCMKTSVRQCSRSTVNGDSMFEPSRSVRLFSHGAAMPSATSGITAAITSQDATRGRDPLRTSSTSHGT